MSSQKLTIPSCLRGSANEFIKSQSCMIYQEAQGEDQVRYYDFLLGSLFGQYEILNSQMFILLERNYSLYLSCLVKDPQMSKKF